MGTVRLYVENGYAKIPTGTSSISGSDVTSATLSNSNYWTKYVDGDASATNAMMTFDAQNRFNNLTNTTPYNTTVGYILFDLGIPFRRIFVDLTAQSPEIPTGSALINADWNDTADNTGWTAGNLLYSSFTGSPDFPFAVVPTNDTNQFRTLSGHTTNNASTVASGGWTGSGDEGNVTRQWTSTVFDCGQIVRKN